MEEPCLLLFSFSKDVEDNNIVFWIESKKLVFFSTFPETERTYGNYFSEDPSIIICSQKRLNIWTKTFLKIELNQKHHWSIEIK